MKWTAISGNGFYINDQRLANRRAIILVTYKTPKGKRYVKQVECLYGRVQKKLNGNIVAWMETPNPYMEG